MKNCNIPVDVLSYIQNVENNSEDYGVEQIQLCKLIRLIFETEELFWDEEQIEKYFSYQKYFSFNLFDWEKFCFVLHICVFRKDGMPRWPDLFILVGRGAGKNAYLAFENFCLLTITHGIKKYDIDICATNEEQAMTTFKDIYDVLENPKYTKLFKKHFYWNKEYIVNKDTGSILKYRTNNAKGKDGLRSGKVDFDEVHAYEKWENIDVYTTGLGKKPHPRRTYITTDGDVRDGPLDELKLESDEILRQVIPDDGMLPFICRISEEKEVHDERNWHHANPSLKFLPNLLEQIKKEYRKYCKNPNNNLSFITKRMNFPKQNREVSITSWENIEKTNRAIPDLEGRACICGIDYTKINDMASCGFLFKIGEDLIWIEKNWFCINSADKERIKAPFEVWENQEIHGISILEQVDAVEISPYLISEFITEVGSRFNIKMYCADNFRLSLLKRALRESGIDADNKEIFKMVRPSDIMRVLPVIESKFDNHNIIVGDNPCFRWAVQNTKKVKISRGNEEYGKKEAKSRKTDPFMSFVQAMVCEDKLSSNEIDLSNFEVFTF